MDDAVRKNIEQIIKDFSLDRNKVFEVSKQKYSEILKKITYTFSLNNETIHRANMGHYKQGLSVTASDCSNNTLWFEKLGEIIPRSENAFYVLTEECRQRPKYWVYEMHTQELKTILREAEFLNDYYIVSKKFDWLISENHHGIVSFIGDRLNLSTVE